MVRGFICFGHFACWMSCQRRVKQPVSLLLCGEVHIFTRTKPADISLWAFRPQSSFSPPFFLAKLPHNQEENEQKLGKSMKPNPTIFLYKTKPKEQIVSAHAQYPVKSLASVHMVGRGGAINPTIIRNYFFCYKIPFHLSTIPAETHSANQNREAPGNLPEARIWIRSTWEMSALCSLRGRLGRHFRVILQ